LSSINFQRTYLLGEEYERIKERANQKLDKYLNPDLYPDLITFNHLDRSVTFYTERLIPTASTNRPRVMLLFSNPHPNSVHQGMFLSPNTIGRENPFWPVMRDAGWVPVVEANRNLKRLANIYLKAEYLGPFELIFYCYYAFPTDDPKDISKIFGKEYFRQFIEREAKDEARKIIQETCVEAVVTFNIEIFNHVSKDKIERYIDRLMEGEVIQSQIRGIDRYVPIFLTFPTGWHFCPRHFRKTSLEAIREDIWSRSKYARK
jgi:hypothetical protein